jgi:hypothetical protein
MTKLKENDWQQKYEVLLFNGLYSVRSLTASHRAFTYTSLKIQSLALFAASATPVEAWYCAGEWAAFFSCLEGHELDLYMEVFIRPEIFRSFLQLLQVK